jgi:flagellar biosynthetic protein FliR
MTLDVSFLPQAAAAYLLIFARIGTMLMLLPGLGERSVPIRVRLTIALMLAGVMFPMHQGAYTINLGQPQPVAILLFQELLVGVVLGLTARLAMSAIQVAGTVVAQQLGLGFVMAFDPTQGAQGVIVGQFLTLVALTLLFAADMHHLVILALSDSYTLFRPGEVPVTGDMASLVTTIIGKSFLVGLQISAPFLVFGLIFNLGLGVLSRLMPQMQVFFIGLPVSIMVGFLILMLVVGAMMTVFLTHVGDVLGTLAPRG